MNIIFVSPIPGGVGANQIQQCSVPRRTIDKVKLKIKD
jgi:hypothetical protein